MTPIQPGVTPLADPEPGLCAARTSLASPHNGVVERVLVRLRDGRPAVIRPIRSDGARRLSQAIQELSPRSRYFRFLSMRSSYPPDQLEPFVHCDGVACIGIVLAPLDEGGRELDPVGVAHCLRDGPGLEAAEVAVAVADAWQGLGVGSLLMRDLAARSLAVGIRRWWATLLAENEAAHRLLLRATRPEEDRVTGGQREFRGVVISPDEESTTCNPVPLERE